MLCCGLTLWEGLALLCPPATHVHAPAVPPLRRQLIQTDMELLSMFASVLDLSPTLKLLALGDTCREWCAVMNEQVGRPLSRPYLAPIWSGAPS